MNANAEQDKAKRIKKIVAQWLGLFEEDVADDKTFDDLYADSLDSVEIVMAVEDEFEIELADELFPKESGTTVGEFVAIVLKALAAAYAPRSSATGYLMSSQANAAHLAQSIAQAKNGQVQAREMIDAKADTAPRMADYFYSLSMLITRRDIEQPFFTQMDAISARIAEPEYEELDGPQITPMYPREA